MPLLDVPLFPNLRHFECLENPCNELVLDKLSSETHLVSLAILWDYAHTYPYFDRFQSLNSLRLSLFEPHGIGCLQNLGLPRTYATLTTLVLHGQLGCHGHRGGTIDCLFYHLDQFYFPNLTAVSMQDMTAHPCELYHFIQRHSSLMEVNIGFRSTPPLLIASLRKLIDGVGVWKRGPEDSNTILDVTHTNLPEPRSPTYFSFSRKPILSNISSISGPKFDMTSLAWDSTQAQKVSISSFLTGLAIDNLNHTLEHFSFASTDPTEAGDFVSFMVIPLLCYIHVIHNDHFASGFSDHHNVTLQELGTFAHIDVGYPYTSFSELESLSSSLRCYPIFLHRQCPSSTRPRRKVTHPCKG